MADWTQNSRGLKLLIAGMTAALVAGLILLVVGLARTAGELSALVGEVDVPVPAGHRLVDVSAADGRLYLGLRDDAGREQVLVLEAATGKELGAFHLRPGP